MPELTGIDLAKEIMVIRPDMRVILCTGFSYLVNADAAKAAGIRAFMMKPLTKREIARTIRDVLDGKIKTVERERGKRKGREGKDGSP